MTTAFPNGGPPVAADASKLRTDGRAGGFLALVMASWRTYRRNKASVVALAFLLAVVLAAVLAPWISPHDPYEAVTWRSTLPGEEGLILGSDRDGRDVLSRLVWGGRVSLLTGIVPTVIAMVISLFIGIVASYVGGWLDQVVMRTLDMFFAFPPILVAIVIAGILEPGLVTVMIAIFIALLPYVTRVVRTTTLSVKDQLYVEAARAGGASGWAIVTRYVLPNVLAPIIVYTTTLMGMMMVLGSGLSFLGLGVQPPMAEWGSMISQGRTVLKNAPHVTLSPGLAIITVSLAFGFIGDGLRDALDPRLRTR